MSLAAPQVLTYLSRSKEKAAHLQIKALGGALDLYHLDIGRFPGFSDLIGSEVDQPVAEREGA